mmetsp:Transcript_1383/g.5664  ORF Transcript_1383/g.5664 Transcript_1383/m.5664 type:complete len:260 (+) Transcript_1383:121-900(+)
MRRTPAFLPVHPRVAPKRDFRLFSHRGDIRVVGTSRRGVDGGVHPLHVLEPVVVYRRVVVGVKRGHVRQSERATRGPAQHGASKQVGEIPGVKVRQQERWTAAFTLRGVGDGGDVLRRRRGWRVRPDARPQQILEVPLEPVSPPQLRCEFPPDFPRGGVRPVSLVEPVLQLAVEVVVARGEGDVRGLGRERRQGARAEHPHVVLARTHGDVVQDLRQPELVVLGALEYLAGEVGRRRGCGGVLPHRKRRERHRSGSNSR